MLVFKYLRPGVVPLVFERDGYASLRFSRASDLNDPYELFLQTNPPLELEEEQAYYKFFLKDIGGFPMLCLSRRPDSVVMWAHYCAERSGICLAFDEDALTDTFDQAIVKDVDYSDEPASIDPYFIKYAATTTKNRHTLAVLDKAYTIAYFTKRSDWSYEGERRILVQQSELDTVTDHLLLARVPVGALRRIIVGDKAERDIVALCEAVGARYNVEVSTFHVGRSAYDPFFSSVGAVSVWDGSAFVDPDSLCAECVEPAAYLNEDELCLWCAISDEHANDVASGIQTVTAAMLGVIDHVRIPFSGAQRKGRAARGGGLGRPDKVN